MMWQMVEIGRNIGNRRKKFSCTPQFFPFVHFRFSAEASAVHLAELNPQVAIKVVTSETLDFYLMSKCKVRPNLNV